MSPHDPTTGQDASTLRGWLPHLGLVALGLAMILGARARHLPTVEALAIAFDPAADPASRVWAMHVAANRAVEREPRLGVGLANAMLKDPNEMIQEAALMVDLARHAVQPAGAKPGAAPPLQEAFVFRPLKPSTAPHRLRSFVLYRRKAGMFTVGGLFRTQLEEARWVVDSLHGGPLPSDEEAARILDQNARISPL